VTDRIARAELVSDVLQITRAELALTLRTQRAVALLGLYLVSAVMAGLGYVLIVRGVEKQALAALVQGGLSPTEASRSLSLASEQGYAQLVAFFAGVPPAALAPAIRESIVLPALLWGSLAFLPFVVVLTSFDLVAGDLATRALVYPALRVSRLAVLLGKLAAQTAIVAVLTAVAAVTLVLLAQGLLSSFSILDALPGLLRVIVLLVPYGFCYLGLTVFASVSTREPRSALLIALGIMVGLRILGWTESASIPLQWLSVVSPARYHAGLWQDGLSAPLTSVLAYLLIGAAFTALAARRLGGRDL
jgi:ABC-type transport system involved in multi-copper enzyme maturation permease subunit